jgi:hypothetical protein
VKIKLKSSRNSPRADYSGLPEIQMSLAAARLGSEKYMALVCKNEANWTPTSAPALRTKLLSVMG